jgi:hypothetical protein
MAKIRTVFLGHLTAAVPQSQQQTVNQVAANLQQQWNTTHSFALLSNMPSVQRGMLTQPHARQIVAQATSTGVSQAFGFLPPSMVPFPARIQPRESVSSMAVPAPSVLKELNALTEAEVKGFTTREALAYCNKFNLAKPSSKDARIQAILLYMGSIAGEQQTSQKQPRGRKRAKP